MNTRIFTTSDIKKLKIPAIARKYECADDYVRKILKGERERNTPLAKGVVKDAEDCLAIIERQTV